MKTFKLWAAALTVLCGTTPSPASSVSVHYSNSVNADLVSATSTPTGDSPQISISLPVLRSQATASPEEILNRLNNEIARLTNSHDEEFDKLNPGEMEIAQSDNDRIVIRAKVSSEFDNNNNNKDDKQVRPATTFAINKLYVSYDRRTSKVDIVSWGNDAVIEYYPHVLRKNLEELTQGMGNDQLWFEQTFFIATEMNRVHEEQHQKDIRSHKEVGYKFPIEVIGYLVKNEAKLSKQRRDAFYECRAIMEARSMAEEARKLFMILSKLAEQKDKDDNEMVPGLFNIKGKKFSLTYGQLREKINNKELKKIVREFVAARKGDLMNRIDGYAEAFRTYYNEKNDVWSNFDNTDEQLKESVSQLAEIDKELYKKYMEKMDIKGYQVTQKTKKTTGETIVKIDFVKEATESLEKIYVTYIPESTSEQSAIEYFDNASKEFENIIKIIENKMDDKQKAKFKSIVESYMYTHLKEGTKYWTFYEGCARLVEEGRAFPGSGIVKGLFNKMMSLLQKKPSDYFRSLFDS